MNATITIENEHWVLRSEAGETLWRSRNGCSPQNQEELLPLIYGNRIRRLTVRVNGGLSPEQISSLVLILHTSPHLVKGTKFEGAELLLGYEEEP